MAPATARRFAENTEVPVRRSREAIEQLLHTHRAKGFAYGWSDKSDRVECVIHDRRLRFELPRVHKAQFEMTKEGRSRSPAQQEQAYQQADRQRWRALLLVIKAKLEAVEAGLSVFDEEFLAFIVTPSGQTVGEILIPQIGPMYTHGKVPSLLTS